MPLSLSRIQGIQGTTFTSAHRQLTDELLLMNTIDEKLKDFSCCKKMGTAYKWGEVKLTNSALLSISRMHGLSMCLMPYSTTSLVWALSGPGESGKIIFFNYDILRRFDKDQKIFIFATVPQSRYLKISPKCCNLLSRLKELPQDSLG